MTVYLATALELYTEILGVFSTESNAKHACEIDSSKPLVWQQRQGFIIAHQVDNTTQYAGARSYGVQALIVNELHTANTISKQSR